eukprot:1088429_1
MFDDHTCDAIWIVCVLCISYAISMIQSHLKTATRIDIIICGLCYRNYSNSVLSLLLDHSLTPPICGLIPVLNHFVMIFCVRLDLYNDLSANVCHSLSVNANR